MIPRINSLPVPNDASFQQRELISSLRVQNAASALYMAYMHTTDETMRSDFKTLYVVFDPDQDEFCRNVGSTVRLVMAEELWTALNQQLSVLGLRVDPNIIETTYEEVVTSVYSGTDALVGTNEATVGFPVNNSKRFTRKARAFKLSVIGTVPVLPEWQTYLSDRSLSEDIEVSNARLARRMQDIRAGRKEK